ncbi:topoisomerase DNA-binding C4 zinc finger domain protein [Firmicutes bacterium CAG:882]|nr:topoisomerase DNA-binding C4 zinc finger domain protein [Firmicutes bacterium CAG:882]
MDYIDEIIEDIGYQGIAEGIIILLLAINVVILIVHLIKKAKLNSLSEEKYLKKYLAGKQKARDIAQSYAQKNILSFSEQDFYKKMCQELEAYNVNIVFKVSLADIFYVKYKDKHFETNLKQLLSQNVDFLIADYDGKALTAIELDDMQLDIKHKNDMEFKDAIFMNKDIKLIHITKSEAYDFKEIKQSIRDYMDLSKFMAKEGNTNG